MEKEFKLMDEAFQNIVEHIEEMAARWADWHEDTRKAYLRGRSYFNTLVPALELISAGLLHPKLCLSQDKELVFLSKLSIEDQELIAKKGFPVVDALTRRTHHKTFSEMTDQQREAVIDVHEGKLRSPFEQSAYYTDKVRRAVEPPPPRRPSWEWDVIGSGEHMYIDMKSPIKLAIPAKRIREMYLALEAREREHKEVRRGR